MLYGPSGFLGLGSADMEKGRAEDTEVKADKN